MPARTSLSSRFWGQALTTIQLSTSLSCRGSLIRRAFGFGVHQHFDPTGSGTSGTVTSTNAVLTKFSSLVASTERLGKQLFCGEFAVGNNADGLTLLQRTLAFIQLHNDVFWGATWWGGGQFTSVLDTNGYYFGIRPYNGADTAFAVVYQRFLPGGDLYNTQRNVPGFDLPLSAGAVFALGCAFGNNGLRTGTNSYITRQVGSGPLVVPFAGPLLTFQLFFSVLKANLTAEA